MTTSSLSTTPPKGTRDWTPEEYRIRNYIFTLWRRVCRSYGYEEYLTPIVEHADVYRAKSGEDIGGKELVTFTDRAGRELCIRPEMTPSVTRMVSTYYESAPKPVRLFSIANYMRNERPQRGRNREFWQLNADLFGAEGVTADLEILSLSLDLMLAFSPPEGSFSLKINHRALITEVLMIAGISDADATTVVRILDKWAKLSAEEITRLLSEAHVSDEGIEILSTFMSASSLSALKIALPTLAESPGLRACEDVFNALIERGYDAYITFAPDIIRGFDYYDGIIFEMFDHHPDNNRAMFGGGRYNGLATIFGRAAFPSIGFAPGDETMKLFLESWGLLEAATDNQEDVIYIPLLDEDSTAYTHKVASILRTGGAQVITGLTTQGISKAMQYASKIGAKDLILAGSDEAQKNIYITKNLDSGEEAQTKL